MSDTDSQRLRIARMLNGLHPAEAEDAAEKSREEAQKAANEVGARERDAAQAEADLAAAVEALERRRAGGGTQARRRFRADLLEGAESDAAAVEGNVADEEQPGAPGDLAELERNVVEAQAALEAKRTEAEQAKQAEDAAVDAAAQTVADQEEDGAQTDQAAAEARKEIAQSREKNDQQLKKLGFWTWLVFTLISGAVMLNLPKVTTWNPPSEWSADALTADVAAALTALAGWVLVSALMLLTKQSGGLRRVFIGKDGRFSTGIVQSVIWTAALFYALLFLTLWTAADSCGEDCSNPFTDLDATYLVLLGGPFAAAAAARATIGAKVASGTVQSVPPASTAVKDLVTDDGGNADLVDIQFLAFNIIALAYFLVGFADGSAKALPSLPEGLVALTSLGALTYATNKALANNAPVITSVVRARGSGPIRPGDVVEIRGVNLVPEGASEVEYLALIRVRFGEVVAPLVAQVTVQETRAPAWGSAVFRGRQRGTTSAQGATSRAVRARVPWGLGPDTYEVTLVTAAGVTTDPVQVRVGEDVPVVLAVRPERLRPGGTAQVIGRSFRTVDTPGQVFVSYNGRNVVAEPVSTSRSGVDRLRVEVPTHLAGTTVALGVVATSGEASETIVVPVNTE